MKAPTKDGTTPGHVPAAAEPTSGVMRVAKVVDIRTARSAPVASAAHWAEISTAAAWLAFVTKRAEEETGDREVREIREGAELVAELCRERAHGESPAPVPRRVGPPCGVRSLHAERLRRGRVEVPVVELTEKQARALAYYAVPFGCRDAWEVTRAVFTGRTITSLERLGLIVARPRPGCGFDITPLGALVHEARVAAGEHFATVAPEPRR